jgi:cysteinyl-tRNA synthetase
MPLHLFNTLSRRVEAFAPLEPERRDAAGRIPVGMYCCGPTVYDFGHIGNFRTFVFADLVRRVLEFNGHAVTHVMNITDVEDKIVRKSGEQGTTRAELTLKYENAFFEDLAALGCLKPVHTPRATDFIPQIIDLIERLEKRGVAYRTADGSMWFSIDRYQGCGCRYGVLKTIDLDQLQVGERVAADEYDKEFASDFALWKARTPEDRDIFWETPWGPGRPGWHIECSAMSMALLGSSFDLHLGGEDLVFPHHEDEIAQSEGAGCQAPGRPFVKHWMHGAHLLVEGRKMSKSLGNYYTVRDLAARGFTGREIRQLLMSAHYRETFNFTLDGLTGARSALARIDECVRRLRECAGSTTAAVTGTLLESVREALNDDLNVSKAWAAVFDWVRESNKALAAGMTAAQAAGALAAWRAVDGVLGLGDPPADEAPAEVFAMAHERVAAKKAKDFAKADALRAAIRERGWIVEDTPSGPKLKRA